jgi:hypothetical protein
MIIVPLHYHSNTGMHGCGMTIDGHVVMAMEGIIYNSCVMLPWV